MLHVRQLLVWLMVACWLPATLHCAMDQASLFDSAPACCDHEEAQSSDDRSCSEHCDVFDRAFNKVSGENLSPAAPVLLALADWLTPIDLKPAEMPVGLCRAATAPPELARTWQFVARAALPPRAPSRLS